MSASAAAWCARRGRDAVPVDRRGIPGVRYNADPIASNRQPADHEPRFTYRVVPVRESLDVADPTSPLKALRNESWLRLVDTAGRLSLGTGLGPHDSWCYGHE